MSRDQFAGRQVEDFSAFTLRLLGPRPIVNGMLQFRLVRTQVVRSYPRKSQFSPGYASKQID
jgi:hypothetical protein